MYLLLVRLITESTSRWVTPFQHTSKVSQSFVLAGCLDTWEIIGVVKFISLFTLNFFVIEQYSNNHLDFVKRNCCTGIRVAYGGWFISIFHTSPSGHFISTYFQRISKHYLVCCCDTWEIISSWMEQFVITTSNYGAEER